MRMRTSTVIAVLVAALLGVVGCGNGGGDEDAGTDAGADTEMEQEDTYQPEDTGTEDTYVPEPDTDQPEDTGTEDTYEPDPDTGGMDTGGKDTGPADTGSADTETDTGMDVVADTESDTSADTTVDATDADADTSDVATDTSGDTATDTGDVSPDATVSEMSIYDIRSEAQSSNLMPGSSLSGTYYTKGVVVTGVQTSTSSGTTSIDGVFVQETGGAAEDSGIWVYLGNKQSGVSVPSLKVGSEIAVKGTVTNYDNNGGSTSGGLLEIHKVSEITLVQQGATVPSPTQVSASTLAPGGSNAEKYESVLVEVTNVSVSSAPNMYGETLLDSGLRIGNTLYDYTQDFSPTSGTTYSSVVGPLNYAFDKTMVAPREKADITK